VGPHRPQRKSSAALVIAQHYLSAPGVSLRSHSCKEKLEASIKNVSVFLYLYFVTLKLCNFELRNSGSADDVDCIFVAVPRPNLKATNVQSDTPKSINSKQKQNFFSKLLDEV